MTSSRMRRGRLGLVAALAVAIGALVVPPALGSGSAAPSGSHPSSLLITADRLFDGTRFVAGAAVLVREGRIAQVGPADQMKAAGVPRLDVPGGTILPGFIDMHTHHLINGVPPVRILEHGVTTARDLGGPLSPVPTDRPFGLRQVLSGPTITPPGGYPGPVFALSPIVEVSTPAQARDAVDQLVAHGSEVIGVSLEPGGEPGAPWSEHEAGSPPPWPILSPEELTAIVTEAHRLDRKVSAYLGDPEGVARALDAGVDEWAHTPCDPIPAPLIERAGRAGVAIDGTLDTLTRCTGIDANARALVAAGARLFYGTDLAHPDIPHGIDAQEIHRQLHTGRSMEQALASATSDAGRYLGLAPLGQLVPGAPADITVINGDPRVNFKELEYPRLVLAGGNIVIQRAPGE